MLTRLALAAGLSLLALVLGVAGWLLDYGFRIGPPSREASVVVTIPKGVSLATIGVVLAEAKLIDEDVRFVILAKLSGLGGKLKAGEFRLTTEMTPYKLLKALASAKAIQHAITIPEGLKASEIGAVFGDGGWFDPRSFANLVVDREFIEKQGLTGVSSLEGYLYPDTYRLTRDNRGAERILAMMIGRFHQVWGDLVAEMEQKPNQGKTVILASMVEKETGAAMERPLIAGVFLNRLQLGMRLQSDPTVVYGLENFSGKITRRHLQTETPYNTYTIAGLPAGPICSPGREALLAVLKPTATKHLYFVSKNDGTHHFSETLAEHNNAVQQYQRKNSEEKGK
jgi:UPF0755 protein